ncbi:MAG: hypothetical protein Q9195_004890 [Heterodermia aff. obscurata]
MVSTRASRRGAPGNIITAPQPAGVASARGRTRGRPRRAGRAPSPPPPPPAICPSGHFLLTNHHHAPALTAPIPSLHAELARLSAQGVLDRRELERALRLRDTSYRLCRAAEAARDDAVMAQEVDRQVQQWFAMEYCAGKRPKGRSRLGRWLDWVVGWVEGDAEKDWE